MKTKCFIPDPDYYVWSGHGKKPWVLQSRTSFGCKGSFKTKKEARRAIPLIEAYKPANKQKAKP